MEDLTPLYNKEFYLAYLCGEDVVLPIPDGNAERYLAYLCGMDVTIPDVPDGRTETYLAYKCGEDVVLPDPMYRIEFYLAKWCGIDYCEVPEPMYRIEYWLAQLANSGELKTVTGNPISVSDALAKPAESLTIEILPQQSGSGDPSPDNVRPISGHDSVKVTRTGKNLLDVASVTHNAYNIGSIPNTLKMGVTYTFSVNGTTDKRYRLYLSKSDNPLNALISLTSDYILSGNSQTFTAPNMDGYDLLCLAGSSNGAGNEPLDNILPQIELGSTATAYEPYSGTSVEIALGQTVYGGTLDVVSGVLTVDRAYYAFNGTEDWVKSGSSLNGYYTYYLRDFVGVDAKAKPYGMGISDKFEYTRDTSIYYQNYGKFIIDNSVGFNCNPSVCGSTVADWKAYLSQNPLQLVYELATPQTIQLTPTEVEMLLGNNTIWNDVGDMVLEYLADGPADDIDALQILLNNRYVNNGGEDEATDREALDILLGGNTR